MLSHYFDQEKADSDDLMLKIAVQQGYVPETCLLGGRIVIGLTNEGKDPCKGCICDRKKCNGRSSS